MWAFLQVTDPNLRFRERGGVERPPGGSQVRRAAVFESAAYLCKM
jgi:hypothetical protein